MRNFFISYNHKDAEDAKWIATKLEEANYTTLIQDWDFAAGNNFVLEMHNAMISCERTIAVLSNNYLASLYVQPEWAQAFAADPTGKDRKLIPVKISECELTGIFKTIIVCDLVGLNRDEAAKVLLDDISGKRKNRPPAFPGITSGNSTNVVKELTVILETSRTTLFVQIKARNKLYLKAKKRLGITESIQKEDFFPTYYDHFNDEERSIHKVIRGYTKDILYEYNTKVLNLLNANPDLFNKLSRLVKLKTHLELWISKYNNKFVENKGMCLVYMAPDDAPFPSGIEDELKKLLE